MIIPVPMLRQTFYELSWSQSKTWALLELGQDGNWAACAACLWFWQDDRVTERLEVQRTIPVDPATIFDIVRDPRGHVAIDASGMLQGFTGQPAGAVGDTFIIHMDRESLGDLPMGRYDVTVMITGYEENQFITWEVSGKNFPSIGHFYGYRLENVDEGTLVTSIYDWSQVDEKWRANGAWPIIPESALKATLGILERTARSSG